MKAWKLFCTFALLGLFSSPLLGQIITFTATLNGAQETPPVPYPGTGSGTLQFNTTTGAWNLSGTFSNLYGTTIDAHIHGPATPGVPAGVVTPISFTSGATSGSFSGSGTFTSSQATDLLAGLYYVNIHTNFYPLGEIRGQLTAVPEPSVYALGAGGAALLTVMISRARRKARAISQA